MIGPGRGEQRIAALLLVLLSSALLPSLFAREQVASPAPSARPNVASGKKPARQDDSIAIAPAKDLLLRLENEHKSDALSHFVEGISFEENGEMDKALLAYRKVLDVDPGQVDLASRVASLLTRQDDFPQAIDVLKDAVKAKPNAPQPLLQLAFIYAKYLGRTDQAIEYANRAIALDPRDFDPYQRLCEIALGAGDQKKALQALDRAVAVKNDDPTFWTRLGKLYASIVFKTDRPPMPDEIARLNDIFKKAADHAGDDATVLKDLADYYASTQQIKEAIPLYLRLLELEPEDANAREKLATGFVLTNQRDKAVGLLEEIIKQHPEKYQPYDLLAGLLDDSARALERDRKADQAKATFAKAAANYEQSMIVNPSRVSPYMHLAELLLGPLKEDERAVKVLNEAREHFPQTPEITYYLAIAQREAKHSQESVATFEEALHEAAVAGRGNHECSILFRLRSGGRTSRPL